MGNTETSEVFAYLGPNDLRYPILLVATMKCGYQVCKNKNKKIEGNRS
jgi:hypothetical protein